MTVKNGYLSIVNSGNTTYFIELVPAEKMKNIKTYTVMFDILCKNVPTENNCIAGFGYGYTGETANEYTGIQFKKEGSAVQLIANIADKGSTSSLKYLQNFDEIDGEYGDDVWLKVKIFIENSHVRIYVNDVFITEADDALTKTAPLFLVMHNKEASGTTEAYFDNIKICEGIVDTPEKKVTTEAETTKAPETTKANKETTKADKETEETVTDTGVTVVTEEGTTSSDAATVDTDPMSDETTGVETEATTDNITDEEQTTAEDTAEDTDAGNKSNAAPWIIAAVAAVIAIAAVIALIINKKK